MQLLVVFALLYLWEGVVFGIPGAVLFAGTRRGFRARPCDGPSLLPLRPGQIAVLAAPLPFHITDEGVTSDVALRRFGTRDLGEAPRTLGFAALADAASRRARIRTGGRVFARAPSPEHAEAGAALLAALGATPVAERAAVLGAWVRDACDVAALRARVEAARRAVRVLGAVCDAYLASLFVLLPLAIATLDETTALLASLPLLALLHAVALVLAWRAHRALRPDARGDRFETLLAALLFPPHLLRLPQRIALAGIGAPRPEVAAAALMEGDARVALLRRALAEREFAGRDAATVLGVAAQAGVEEAALRRPPLRGDPLSAAYCPVCLAEYRAGFETCADCRAPLVAWGAEGNPA